jgi:subtilisin-like proprotein convertase family protein
VPPASGSTVPVDAISDRLMYRLQYRNFGAYESLVVNHTVDTGGDHAGVRYYQLKRLLPGGSFTVNEQATFAPDAAHRWMGSAAMDSQGNLAVGFSVSSTSVFPSIRYAGRLFSDPPGGLFQGETTLIAGSNSQTTSAARWGDYSSMSIDPTDDCTFWYTTEYYTNTPPACPVSNFRCWQTRIGAFKFPACAASTTNGTIQGTVTDASTTLPIAGALVQTNNGFARTTNAAGFYSMTVPAGTYNMTASKTGYATGTATGVVVLPSSTTTQDFALVGVPILVFNSSAVDDSGAGGNNNGVIDVNECCNINLSIANTGAGAATGVSATITTSTPGVTILQGSSAYPNIPPGGNATNTTPFRIQTAPSFLAGTRINISIAVTTDQGPFNLSAQLNTSTPSGASASFSATGPVPIPDNNPAGAVLNVPVSGLTSAVSKVVVQLRITHTFDSDLTISLIGPDSTAVNLSVQRGGSGDNFGTDCPASSNDTVFDDAAATPISAGAPPFVGTFRPDQPLSGFVGKPANGTWQLKVVDGFAIDIGNIECVTLVINGFNVSSGGCKAGADFNGDSQTDILWRNYATGDNIVWFMNGTALAGGAVLTPVADTNWKIVGTADFNADGKVDILWRNQSTGDNIVWLMNGTAIAGGAILTPIADTKWTIVATGDFNADGKPDILWRHVVTGDNLVWFMNGTALAGGAVLTSVPDTNWSIVGAGDFNADAKTDILWRNYATGDNVVWFMNGTTIAGGAVLTTVGDVNWKIVAVGDFNSDAKPDIVWRHALTGDDLIWLMNGTTIAGGAVLPAVSDTNWWIVGPK